jgi:hypothetical protein
MLGNRVESLEIIFKKTGLFKISSAISFSSGKNVLMKLLSELFDKI